MVNTEETATVILRFLHIKIMNFIYTVAFITAQLLKIILATIQQHRVEDMLHGVLFNQTKNSGIVRVRGLHSQSKAYLFKGSKRNVRLPETFTHKLEKFIDKNEDITFLASLKQTKGNGGSIFSFSSGFNRYLELQSSGRRNEIRFHYRSNNKHYSISLRYNLADNQWHKIAVSLSGQHLQVYVDCKMITKRIIHKIDRISNKAKSLWLGQRSSRSFLFKGILQDVKIVSGYHGYLVQCPNTDSDCPTCSQFNNLEDIIKTLQTSIILLNEKLQSAEKRLDKLELCDCSRKCRYEDKTKRDGDIWRELDPCRTCNCQNGAIKCRKRKCSPAPCKFPVKKEGLCCPVCLKKCFINNRYFDHGESYIHSGYRSCRKYLCQDGSLKYVRSERCPVLSCREQVKVPNKCCKVCKGADTDFCAENTCSVNAICNNVVNRYICKCKRGYRGNGHVCTDIDECKSRGDPRGNHCGSNTRCVNTQGSYRCQCLPKFRKVSNSAYSCKDINECSSGVHQCDKNALCANTHGGYTCKCQSGWRGDGLICKPICVKGCLHNGTCTAPGQCQCRSGWTGNTCDEDIDECELEVSKCAANSLCENYPGWYRCLCKQGFLSEGEEDNQYGKLCIDQNECDEHEGDNTCPDSAVCVNTPGSYHCTCARYTNCSITCLYRGTNLADGALWVDVNDKCIECMCSKGIVTCAKKDCDCDQIVDTNCCPQCSQKARCFHHETGVLYDSGDIWNYECETCECLGGEIDCWSNTCPVLSCNDKVQDEGHCCPRCNHANPCNNGIHSNKTLPEKSCFYENKYYQNGAVWRLKNIDCVICHCKNGFTCCTYDNMCSHIKENSKVYSHESLNNITNL